MASSCANIRGIEVLFMARLVEGRWSSRPKALVRRGTPVLSWDRVQSLLRKKPVMLSGLPWQGALLVLAVLACLGPSALGQTDVNDVHVQPREIEKSKDAAAADASKENPANIPTNGLSAHVRPLKVDVDLVLVPVTITDPMNRLVTGLDKENFQLF